MPARIMSVGSRLRQISAFRLRAIGGAAITVTVTIAADDLTPDQGQSVAFSATISSGIVITSYLWTFPDGSTSTSATPSYAPFGQEQTVTVLINGSYTDTLTFTPNVLAGVATAPDQTFTELSAPTDCLDVAFVAGVNTLTQKRLGQCLVEKLDQRFVSATGLGSAGDGTLTNPWGPTAAEANEALSLRIATKLNARRFAIADAVDLRSGGRSFSCWGHTYISAASSFFGTLMARAPVTNYAGGQAIEWAILLQSNTLEPMFFRQTAGGFVAGTAGATAFPADQWVKWAFTFDDATHDWKLYVNGSVTYSGNTGADLISVVGAELTFGAATGPIFSAGGVAQTAVWYDRVLTAGEVATLGGGGGQGLIYEQVPVALRTGLKGWWEFDEDGTVAVTSYANKVDPTRPFTSTVLGVLTNFTPAPVDAAVTASGTDAIGGANINITFLPGTYTWNPTTDGGILNERSNVTLDITGATLSFFDKQFPVGSSWTADTGTTYYATATVDCRGWLKKIGDDTAGEVEAPLYLAETIAECRATANSYTWDSANGGRVYLNVGAHPDTVSPTGWEAIPWDFAADDAPVPAMIVMGRLNATTILRLDGGGTCNILGGGNSIPGTTGSAAVYMYGDEDSEWAMTGVRMDCVGYHGFTSSTGLGSRGVTALNVVGCGTWRNEGATLNGGNGDPYVQFVGSPGGNEGLSWYDRCTGGYRPDYKTNFRTRASIGYRFHDGPLTYQAVVGFGITADSEGGTVASGPIAGSSVSAATIQDVRSWVIGTTCDIANLSITAVAINGAHINCIEAESASAVGYARSVASATAGTGWLVNSAVSYTISGDNPNRLYGNNGGPAAITEVWLGGQITVNTGSSDFKLNPTGVTTVTTNTILSVTTSGTKGTDGTLTPTYTAFFGYTAAGTGAVTLASAPAYPPVTAAGLMVGAGTTSGTPEYDVFGTDRTDPYDIGPVGT